MKDLSVSILTPYLIVKSSNKTLAIPTMVLSTIYACALLHFAPHLATLWMQLAVVPPRA